MPTVFDAYALERAQHRFAQEFERICVFATEQHVLGSSADAPEFCRCQAVDRFADFLSGGVSTVGWFSSCHIVPFYPHC